MPSGISAVTTQVRRPDAPRLIIGSHLDTVPHAGAFDGILGVVLGVELVELLIGRRFHFAIEVVGFSEEEGVRFGVPFIGSRALIGDIDDALVRVCAGRRDPRLWARSREDRRRTRHRSRRSAISSFTSSKVRCWRVWICRSVSLRRSRGRAVSK